MSDLQITKDDIGKVFIRRDGVEEVIIYINPHDINHCAVQTENGGSYALNGRYVKNEERPWDLIKRKEETMWIKHDGAARKLPMRTIVVIKNGNGDEYAGYADEFNWVWFDDDENFDVHEYRIVEAAPEEKPEPKRVELKDMWKIWYKPTKEKGNFRRIQIHTQLIEGNLASARTWIGYNDIEVLAITKGDAVSFYEGEGL